MSAREPDIDELMATKRWCYTIPREGFVKGKGWRVSILIEGIQGHYPTGDLNFGKPNHVEPWFWGDGSYHDAEQFCAEQNQKLGLDVSDVWAIVMSTLAGDGRSGSKRSRRGSKPVSPSK